MAAEKTAEKAAAGGGSRVSGTVLSILFAAAFFCLIIVIHEFGHFIVAKKCGIRVDEFAIGMGPVIYKKQGEETLFTLRLLPIGGFCSMGEDIEDDDPNSFRKKPVPSRIAVIAAGAVMNLILGFILSVVLLLVDGRVTSSEIVWFSDDAVSTQYGLQMNDTIVKINGVRIFSAKDIIYQLGNDEDGIVDFVVRRNGELVRLDNVRFEMKTDPATGKSTLIYDFKVQAVKITAANLVPYSFKNALYYGRIVLMSLRDIIRGKYGVNDLQGPVGIVTTIGDVAEQSGFDISFLLDIATLVTINIGIFNLLPVPALDGGRLVLLIVEAIRRKAMKAETEGMIHFVGFALLMVLMVVVTFNDVKNIFVK
ncbi:MAG: site-2 protease family protein [Oscillospiraceae bacterium]|nr:site-2 protease family protein [Oscillospiraceae bacterium]